MPGLLDFALITLFAAVWPLYAFRFEWPRHVRAVAAGDPGARTREYCRTIGQQWTLVALALLLVWWDRRPLAALGLRAPEGWPLWLGLGLAVVYTVLLANQLRVISGSAPIRARLRARLQPLVPLLPHTAGEIRLWVPLSLTAGLCEEFLFRGYLVWALTPWLGAWGAAGASVVVFGLAHGYQGLSFGVRAFAAGAVLGALAMGTGSILPGMLLHALIDLGSGYTTHLALRDPGACPPTPAASA